MSESIYGTCKVAEDDGGGVLLLREVGKQIGIFIVSVVLIRAIPIGVIIAGAVITRIVPSCIPEGFFDVGCRWVLLVRGSGLSSGGEAPELGYGDFRGAPVASKHVQGGNMMVLSGGFGFLS